MSPCRWAGAPCPNEATKVARIANVGDRPICDEHIGVMDNLGMAYRLLDAAAAPVQEWRTRTLTRDMTGLR